MANRLDLILPNHENPLELQSRWRCTSAGDITGGALRQHLRQNLLPPLLDRAAVQAPHSYPHEHPESSTFNVAMRQVDCFAKTALLAQTKSGSYMSLARGRRRLRVGLPM